MGYDQGYVNTLPSPPDYRPMYPQYAQKRVPTNDPLSHAFGIWAQGGESINRGLDFDTWLAKNGGAEAFNHSVEPAIQRDKRIQLLADILGGSNISGIV